jgi:hypothetical protein
MPNRSCDFCGNSYKNNPSVGYYKVSDRMRLNLSINKLMDCNFDFICGDHFSETCFDENGRLSRESIPTMFPYRECLNHDHSYNKTDESVGKDTGTYLLVIIS